jgi:hypothetical protein
MASFPYTDYKSALSNPKSRGLSTEFLFVWSYLFLVVFMCFSFSSFSDFFSLYI